ncbi:MAG: molybdenum cofactor guanylyltransferase [Deltaproteobacteria bacterium]|nr:molybdenum cofactor guanylyltransferase [Deltaproteobacteria bacterium]
MFSGVVLAGGKSKRMGVDKRHVLFSGMTLLELSIKRLRTITEEALVVMGQKEDLDLKDVRFVLDLERERGPMVGLFSGLSEMRNFYGLVTPIDVPLLTTKFLNYLKENVIGYDAVVPRWKGGIEPLIAVYSKNLLPSMKGCITKERDPAPHLFVQKLNLKVRFIKEEEISRFGNPEILFLNINTQEDLNKAKRILKGNDLT